MCGLFDREKKHTIDYHKYQFVIVIVLLTEAKHDKYLPSSMLQFFVFFRSRFFIIICFINMSRRYFFVFIQNHLVIKKNACRKEKLTIFFHVVFSRFV